jgi:hypothetical protein
LLARCGLPLLVEVIDRHQAGLPLERFAKAGLLSIPSALALMFAKPTLMSFAQNGTSPQRITSKLRSLAFAS